MDSWPLSAVLAVICTASHGVGATPKPAGANIGLLTKYARHPLSAM